MATAGWVASSDVVLNFFFKFAKNPPPPFSSFSFFFWTLRVSTTTRPDGLAGFAGGTSPLAPPPVAISPCEGRWVNVNGGDLGLGGP